MHELMAETGETANLAIADGGQVVFISQVETHEPIRAFFRPGTRGPIHASGIGKALLAYHPPEAVERIVREQGLAAFTDADHHRPRRGSRQELAAIRGARLGGRRRRAHRGDALHRGADLQRVPRGDRRGLGLAGRRCGWSGPAATRSARGCGRRPTGSPGRSAAPRPEGTTVATGAFPGIEQNRSFAMIVEIVGLSVAWAALTVALLQSRPRRLPYRTEAQSSQPRSRK